ncbi:VOC family protein [Chungangia koreensis]|uniref:VOC family protein n=1 Tax=Chungangia koreensis TaxID=752657 RepID=A0ABV8X8D4_9LACT
MTQNITSIGQIAVIAKNTARAVTFYKDVLGLPLLFETNGLAFFQCGETRLLVSKAETEEFDHPGSVLYFKVEDLEGKVAVMKDRGAEFLDEPHVVGQMGETEIWMTFFKDTEGNTLSLMTER